VTAFRVTTFTQARYLSLAFLERPQHGTDYLDQHLGHERGYYEWARDGKTFPLIDRTFQWLEAGIFIALAVLAGGACYWWVTRRAA